MDLPTVTCASPSCILPSHEVVSSEVSQAGPGCCQLRTIASFLYNTESLSGSIRNNEFVMYILPLGLCPMPRISFCFLPLLQKHLLQGSSYSHFFLSVNA